MLSLEVRCHAAPISTLPAITRRFGAFSFEQEAQESAVGWHLLLGGALRGVRAAGLSYLILAKHSFRRSSSERTCVSMVFCNASMPLLDNSAEALLSRFCFQSRVACLVALWASDVALRYAFMQESVIEHVWHS